MTPEEALANLDMDKIMKEFALKIRAQKEEYEAFLNSEECQLMINDMIRVQQGINNENFTYFPEEVKKTFGWEDKSNEQIELFISSMSDTVGIEEKDMETDEDCSFSNFSFVRKGIRIDVMIGQGSSINLVPENA